MKNFFLPLIAFCVLLASCKKTEEPEPVDNNPPSVPAAHGCYVQNIIAWNLNPYYTFDYYDEYPNVLDMYKVYDEISGDVMHTYVTRYDNLSSTLELDSLIHYYGDIVGSANYDDVTTFHYTWSGIGGVPVMDSAQVFVYDFFGGGTLKKGTIIYQYEDGLLDTLFYFDQLDTDVGTLNDEYFIKYVYDDNDQMTELHYHNYNGVETYSEIHTLTNYIQPNYLLTTNPALNQANLFAPEQTIGWYAGSGTYTYNYLYQVNDKNYVVEQSQIQQNGDTTFLKLFNYECYE